MSAHLDDCEYWDHDRKPLFESDARSVERVKIGYDRHCDLLVISGYYEGIEINPDVLIEKLVPLRKKRPS
jgi:hypothetical protein